ncbi:MAG: Uma2 family endonuclease [Planctomycetes bacterium]|nr:Uma2 family endonuclease [Planctomycetota bacterium]
MLETGILQDGQPIELLDGFLVYKDRSARGEDPMTIGTRHNTAIKLLSRLDGRLAPLGCHIQTQGPITIPPSHEPEPDGAVVRGEPREYLERHAGPGDVSSVFEVAESSLELDRTRKLEIYARAGIAQYVIVNLVDDRLDVFERPNSAQGAYEWHAERTAGDALSLLVPGGTRLDIPVLLLLP